MSVSLWEGNIAEIKKPPKGGSLNFDSVLLIRVNPRRSTVGSCLSSVSFVSSVGSPASPVLAWWGGQWFKGVRLGFVRAHVCCFPFRIKKTSAADPDTFPLAAAGGERSPVPGFPHALSFRAITLEAGGCSGTHNSRLTASFPTVPGTSLSSALLMRATVL